MTELRITQEGVETLSDADPNLRLTQEGVETASYVDPNLRLTQVGVEVLSSNVPKALLITQEGIEVASSTSEVEPTLELTQVGIEIVALEQNEVSATSLYRLSLVDFQAPGRATTLYRLTVAEFESQGSLTTLYRLTLAEAVPCLTFWATMWRIERTDGQVFAFTSHDRDLVFRGETYRACESLSASASELGAMLGDVGNMELAGIISDDSIKGNELLSGLFDGAEIEVWLFPWESTGGSTPRRLIAGNTGNLAQRLTGFTMEVLTVSQMLQQRALVEMVTPGCRFDLGDSRCQVDLEALRLTGTVTSVPAVSAHNQAVKRIFSDTSRAEATGYWDQGTLTFTSGDNNGLSIEVKSFTSGTDQFVLWEPALYPISVGDTYSVVPGCDKTKATCIAKFDNYINFGGFPDLPGGDEIAKTPNAGGGIP